MSKAVTNEEVEDVLSSIRRLVSEDKRPLAGLRSAPVEEVATQNAPVEEALEDEASVAEDVSVAKEAAQADRAEANRLVLTPALRVLPSEPEIEDDGEEDGSEEGPLDLGSVARETWTKDAEDADLPDEDVTEEAGSGPMVLFPTPPEKSKDAAMEALDALVHDAIENEAKAIEDELDEADYGDEEFWDDDESSDAVDTDAEPEQGTDEAAEHSDDENWDLQEDAVTEQPVDSFEYVSDLDDAPEAEFEDVSVPDEDMAPKVEPISAAAPLTAKIAALEAALRGTHQEWEPDGDEADTLTLTDAAAMAWEDDVELDAKGAPFVAEPVEIEDAEEAEAERESAPETTSFSADDQVMDEDALRDLVSEIVRAELQGALGERITRNVRKLVRREIHRALTAQEME